jgi:two-component system, sporulation sensor kinase A
MLFENKNLLIVDDEEDLRDALVFDFKRMGFRVFTAENGTKGFDLFKKENIHLVLSDVRMAGGDGIELLKNIKAFRPEVPVILCTGFAEISDEEAKGLGAFEVVYKPFERKKLKEIVSSSLEEKIS